MTYRPQVGDKWVGVTQGMSGHFAVICWLNPGDTEMGPFVEPWDTGIGRYATREEALEEAAHLAQEMQLPLDA